MADPEKLEGLAYLRGARPSPTAPWALGALVALGSFVARRVAGLRWTVEGREHLPAGGGYIIACAIHRSWIDAPLLIASLPLEPRIWSIGSGVAAFKSRWTGWLLRRLGGLLPVYRGGTDVEVHVEAARAVVEAGAVFAIFPEGTRHGDPLEPTPFRRGVGLIALRTGAPIVPVVMAGTHELYRGRRLAVRVLPPTTALELAALTEPPIPGTAGEIEAARRVTAELQSLMAPPAAAMARACEDPPTARRRWRWLTTLVR